ncbi:MAG TPA: YHS domain-containing protein, partial [Acidimicrobiia bacterium]|nr:YHS domain-containing protein [Acidimicrobiia bacterium]
MRDPVCGMTVGDGALKVDAYPEYGFCSEHCRSSFLADPESYNGGSAGHHSIDEDEAAEEDSESVAAPVLVGAEAKAGESETVQLAVEGMSCASCVSTIENALGGLPGVVEARVSFASEQATVDIVPDTISPEDLIAAVESAGYSARPAGDGHDTEDEAQKGRERLYRTLLKKFWFAAVVSLPVIYYSYPEIFPGVREKGSAELNAIWAGMAVLTFAVMAWSGSQFYTGAWSAFKHRSANMFTLIALGISAAWIYSTVALLFPGVFPEEKLRDVFYDVTAVVTALVVLGSALEIRARAKTSEALKKLIGLQAKTARVIRDGAEVEIPVEQVEI